MHVVITGAGRGIGKALADGYRAGGDKVTGTARDDSADVRLDVTRPQDHAAMASTLAGQPVDLLVCNAGVYLDKAESLPGGYPAEQWDETFEVNVKGVFLTVQALLPNLELAQAPKVAIISSQMGSSILAKGNALIYRASKAAALNLGLNLATALKPQGIAVGIYHPGWVRTDMGGSSAAIGMDEAANGLSDRFAVLSLATTGCFETWDGRPHAI